MKVKIYLELLAKSSITTPILAQNKSCKTDVESAYKELAKTVPAADKWFIAAKSTRNRTGFAISFFVARRLSKKPKILKLKRLSKTILESLNSHKTITLSTKNPLI